MQNGIVVDQNDVKKILAKHFGVDEKQVVKSQYSYFVTGISECKEDKQG